MSTPASYSELGPLPKPPVPFLRKIQYYVGLVLLKYGSRLALYIFSLIRPRPRESRPTLTKTYPAHPHLTHRIFYPPTYRPGHSNLPLYLDIHGGGFALMAPEYDDEHNALLAQNSSCIVISLDYSKSPSAQFPVPVRELVSTVSSILSDISLSFDHSRVCIGGFSAGGNLALAVAQHASLRRKIHGVVAYYAVTDFSIPGAEKKLTRPYTKAGEVDSLLNIGAYFNYGYIPDDQDLRHPLLSPSFVPKREDLPEWLCFVGAEMDMLCHEMGCMAGRLAGIDVQGNWQPGRRERDGWEAEDGRIKWVLVKNAVHGFTHFMGQKGEEEQRRRVQAETTAREVGAWLARGPFAGAEAP